jgi:hypothetical protein
MFNQLSFAETILGNAHDRECQESCCLSFNERLRREGMERLDIALAVKGDSKAATFNYVDGITLVDLVCGHCGAVFQKTPSTYKNASFIGGCKGCAGMARRIRQARERFEAKMRENGDRPGPNYSYVNTQIPVSIICGKCGTESMKPPNDYRRRRGCIVCADQCPVTARKNFIAKVLENGDVMGDRFEYVDTQTRVYLTCGVCDREFYGAPNDYMRDQMSCKKCGNRCPIEAREDLERKIAERGDSKAPDYCYVDPRTKVSILCGKCGEATMRWPHHYRGGAECRCSQNHGFDSTAPAILYYIAFHPAPDLVVYKIGVTNKTVEYRYKQTKTPYEVIWTRNFESGRECYEAEQRVVKQYAEFRCSDSPVDGLGNKELFDRDILAGRVIGLL